MDVEDLVRWVEALVAVLVLVALAELKELGASAHLMAQLQRFELNPVNAAALMDQVQRGAQKSLRRLARHRSSHL